MGYYDDAKPFADLLGKTITSIDGRVDDNEMTITYGDGSRYRMDHDQDCCEHVSIEDICGDIEDLIGSPITMANEEVNSDNPDGVAPEYQDSFTWTFYKLGTAKGTVTIRWYGESNGYYSESVSFCLLKGGQ